MNQHSEEMLRVLNEHASEFAAKATLLSNMLEEVEAFLQRLEGKTPVEIIDDDEVLTFSRDSGEWRLLFLDSGGHAVVTESSVSVKARAARLLPKLLDQLIERQQSRLVEVDEALAALKQLPLFKDKKLTVAFETTGSFSDLKAECRANQETRRTTAPSARKITRPKKPRGGVQ